MPEWLRILVVLVGVRVACLPLIQTWFVPDEYWQATEVAHSLAFGYGYRTWEWREAIRSALYPGLIAGLFQLLAFLGADTPFLLVHTPRLLHAVAFAMGDYHFWKLSGMLYGSGSAWWSLICLCTAWFLNYCAPRSLTSCLEMVLLSKAFCSFPWRREKESLSAGYLWPVGLACVVRPTAAVPFFPLVLQHLWRSNHRCRLLLHYIAITATILALTVSMDSWYYGTLVVVPWRFIHFNVVSGLSAHYGTLPWHWYVSQGVPATLTTHLPPFLLGLCSQPARHKDLLPSILGALFIYSCLGHKEFRFLLPVLPLCLCVAGDTIAFHLTAHSKRSGHPAGHRFGVVVFLSLLLPNACTLLYLGMVHQRGVLDVMQVLRAEVEAGERVVVETGVHLHPPNILFLMPCHSTPYYSHLHKNVTMRFLTCEPNLKQEEGYLDEADLFDLDPLTWLKREYGDQTTPHRHFSPGEGKGGKTKQEEGEEDIMKEEEIGMLGKRRERLEDERLQDKNLKERNWKEKEDRKMKEEKEKEENNKEIIEKDKHLNNWEKERCEKKKKEEKEEANKDRQSAESVNKTEDKNSQENVELGDEGKEYYYSLGNKSRSGKPKDISALHISPLLTLPSHIVMFSVLSGKVEEFLSAHHYHLCHELFHAHLTDGRRSTHIHVHCKSRPRSRPRG